MIDPLVIGLTKEYIAKEDRNSENPTVWIVGALDSFTQSKLVSTWIDLSMENGTPKFEKSKQAEHSDFSIVRYGLKGFKNFGKVEFKTEKIKLFDQEFDVVPDDILKKIPLEIIHELATVIWGGNQVDKELKKN